MKDLVFVGEEMVPVVRSTTELRTYMPERRWETLVEFEAAPKDMEDLRSFSFTHKGVTRKVTLPLTVLMAFLMQELTAHPPMTVKHAVGPNLRF